MCDFNLVKKRKRKKCAYCKPTSSLGFSITHTNTPSYNFGFVFKLENNLCMGYHYINFVEAKCQMLHVHQCQDHRTFGSEENILKVFLLAIWGQWVFLGKPEIINRFTVIF